MGDTGAVTITIPRAMELVVNILGAEAAGEFLGTLAQRDADAFLEAFAESRRAIRYEHDVCMGSSLSPEAERYCTDSRQISLDNLEGRTLQTFGSNDSNSISEYDLCAPYKDANGIAKERYHAVLSLLHAEFARLLSGRTEAPGK